MSKNKLVELESIVNKRSFFDKQSFLICRIRIGYMFILYETFFNGGVLMRFAILKNIVMLGVFCLSFQSRAYALDATPHKPFAMSVNLGDSGFQGEGGEDAVWKIHNVKPGEKPLAEKHFHGTAFFISPNRFITNFHVLHDLLGKDIPLRDITLSQEKGLVELKISRLLSVSAIYDLALVEIEGSVKDYLSLGESRSLGKELSVIGYVEDFLAKIRQIKEVTYEDELSYLFAVDVKGIVRVSEGPVLDNQVSVLDTNIMGASGGPVLDHQGKVVGVVHSGFGNIVHSVNFESFKKFLAGEEGSTCSQPILPRSCFKEESEVIKKRAEEGDALAQYQIGRMDSYIEREPEVAIHWLQESANSDIHQAQNDLGLNYFYGHNGVAMDLGLAFALFHRAAEKGYVVSQYSLAIIYYQRKTKENLDLAFSWFKKAADQGDARSQEFLKQRNYRE